MNVAAKWPLTLAITLQSEKGKMKQVLQSYKTGKFETVEIPAPALKAKAVLVEVTASLISVGTERYMLDMARKSLLGKAMARPDLLRQFISKAQAEGIMEAWRQAMGRLDTPVPLGYSSAGVVVDVGPGVEGFTVGDRVACTGSGYAGHVEVASVPVNLCAKIPGTVDFEAASFVALGGIALEAVRMARVSLGETVVVIGLGLLGQIAVQLLSASGCHVIGMDIDRQKADTALRYGAEFAVSDYAELSAVNGQITKGAGADAVLIFAATRSNEPLERAAELSRERGRIVAAGLVGLEIPRKLFYEKELEFTVSRAWGPGLYDPVYSEKGVDYPIAYARWTAKRNMEEFLSQLAKGNVKVDHLITHRFPFDRALEAYDLILKGKEPYIGVLLTYPEKPELHRTVQLKPARWGEQRNVRPQKSRSTVGIGLIGAGQFAMGTLLPAMKGIKGLQYRGVATSTGLSARHVGEKFGFEYCSSNYQEILNDPAVELVFILTRHGSHADLVAEALKAGKHVFVEKPLALTVEQLQRVKQIYDTVANQGKAPVVMVGFNRRFSPFSRWIQERFEHSAEPVAVHCTVNAGIVPPDHWVHDPQQGGGRIVGEVCHFVDLIEYFTGSVPVRVYAESLRSERYKSSDNVVVTMKMANGAIGSITYVAGGDKRYPRERIEVFGGGAVGVIDNFRSALFVRGGRKKRKRSLLDVDRGHKREIVALAEAIQTDKAPPVSFEEYLYTTLATFAIEESIRKGVPVSIDLDLLSGATGGGNVSSGT